MGPESPSTSVSVHSPLTPSSPSTFPLYDLDPLSAESPSTPDRSYSPPSSPESDSPYWSRPLPHPPPKRVRYATKDGIGFYSAGYDLDRAHAAHVPTMHLVRSVNAVRMGPPLQTAAAAQPLYAADSPLGSNADDMDDRDHGFDDEHLTSHEPTPYSPIAFNGHAPCNSRVTILTSPSTRHLTSTDSTYQILQPRYSRHPTPSTQTARMGSCVNPALRSSS